MIGKPPQQNDGDEVPFWTPGHPWLHETGNNDRAWYGVDLLTEAARKVYDGNKAQLPDGTELHLAINSAAAMLTGYAIGCALKGLWVKTGNKVVVNGRYARIPHAGDHALDELARALGKCIVLPVSEEELSVLKRLSAFRDFRRTVPNIADSGEDGAGEVALRRNAGTSCLHPRRFSGGKPAPQQIRHCFQPVPQPSAAETKGAMRGTSKAGWQRLWTIDYRLC
jgi:hypothetical protein